jgi:hypothetical protein
MLMIRMAAAVVLLAALSPVAAQAKWQDTHQKHDTAILVAPQGHVAPQPGRGSGGTLTLQTVNPALQGDLQTANAQKR